MTLRAEEFGVEPNKDCTRQLQAACDAAVKAGDELLIKPGTYLANVEVNEVRGLILRGSGRNKTTIKGIAVIDLRFARTGFGTVVCRTLALPFPKVSKSELWWRSMARPSKVCKPTLTITC